jgi:hypothetical protein
MAKFEKGIPRPIGAGRKAGTPNRATSEFKEAIADLISCNQDKLQIWLDDVAEEDPAKAFDLLLKMMEFVIPKLSRVDYKEPESEEREAPQVIIRFLDSKTTEELEGYIDNHNCLEN